MTVPVIGTGTQDDPYRPDIPEGTSFVGHCDLGTGTYLIAIAKNATVSAKAGRTELSSKKQKSEAINARGLRVEDIDTWKIG